MFSPNIPQFGCQPVDLGNEAGLDLPLFVPFCFYVSLGAALAFLGTKVVPLGAKVVPSGAILIPLGATLVPLGAKLVPLIVNVVPLVQEVGLVLLLTELDHTSLGIPLNELPAVPFLEFGVSLLALVVLVYAHSCHSLDKLYGCAFNSLSKTMIWHCDIWAMIL